MSLTKEGEKLIHINAINYEYENNFCDFCDGRIKTKKWIVRIKPMKTSSITILCYMLFILSNLSNNVILTEGKLADRSRIVKQRYEKDKSQGYRDKNNRPIEGQSYVLMKKTDAIADTARRTASATTSNNYLKRNQKKALWDVPPNTLEDEHEVDPNTVDKLGERKTGQMTGCCSSYKSYYADDMCTYYGYDCQDNENSGNSHDSGDGSCYVEGLAFIGISFSVQSTYGNPYSYQLNDQFPMDNIIDRKYDYIMSMDEDGWLVGGGYKTFDYSGKMPYIDSSHTELLRVGSMNPATGGTSIAQVVSAMENVYFPAFQLYPEYLKGGGGHHSGDNDDGEEQTTPSADVTLVVSIVCTYDSSGSYCIYDQFIEDLFSAMYAVSAGACMDDKDTDPHVSMSRGVKFKSSYHSQQYMYAANLEVAVWQAMYPKGVVIGSSGSAAFPPGRGGSKQKVGYGSLYFFFDRANITTSFSAYSDLTEEQYYYATLRSSSDVSSYYESTTSISFDYAGSGDDGSEWEHNPYGWKATMAKHDMTDGWDLPPNCYMEGETFIGIPLSRKSESAMQSSETFQEQFDWTVLIDYNYTYVTDFGTNHGWLIGEVLGNAIGSIVDKDTSHIPLFYMGTTNPDMGGMSLSDMIKVIKYIEFGTLYIKPAFVFLDDDGHLKLQFEADANSAMGYLYTTLCKQLGITWNYNSPSNDLGLYTNCAMHAAGDKASNGCGPSNGNSGGFCPQMYLAYGPKFQSGDHAAAYLSMANQYVDYWRSLYPNGVAVGADSFCPSGGCLGLFLNRYDLYQVFSPDLGGSWVEYNGASMAPTISPAPTYEGGCDEPRNFHLDKCFRRNHKAKASKVAWDSLGSVGQFTVFLVAFMATTLSLSIFLARARRRKRKNESYLSFFFRDLNRKRRRKRRNRKGTKGLEEDLMASDRGDRSSRRSRSRGTSRSRSKSAKRSQSRSGRSRSRSRAASSGRSRSRQRPKNGEDQRALRPSMPQAGDGTGSSRRNQLV